MTLTGIGGADLSSCDREPLHVPGSVQPHGALLAFDPDGRLVMHSANAAVLLGAEVVPGMELPAVVSPDLAASLADPGRREAQPLSAVIGGRSVDVHAHHLGDHLVVELEPAQTGPAETAVHLLRTTILRLSAAASVAELCDIAAVDIRALTGFDRVMVHRFDPHGNGEVLAEDRHPDLESFLGLRYPAADVPAPARALYLTNATRLIADVGATPSPLEPQRSPLTGEPLDLSQAHLRSVSPRHVEYLKAMGVAATMSIALVEHGRLWGLIACYHHAGPVRPAPRVRAAAEFLGQVISMLLVARGRADSYEATIRVQKTQDVLARRLAADGVDIPGRLRGHHDDVLALVGGHGAALRCDGSWQPIGRTPGSADLDAVAAWAAARDDDVVSTDSLGREIPELERLADVASGVLAARFAGDGVVLWFRPEVVQTVDWGDDAPTRKAVASDDGPVRVGPRTSFALWKETMRLTANPWMPADHAAAEDFARRLSDAVLRSAQEAADLARRLQQALAPTLVPRVGNLSIAAAYRTSGAGEVGGDWYDVLDLPDDGVAVILGDVAGHGLSAAVTMAQLRHAAQAYLLTDDDPAACLLRLNSLAHWMLPGDIATAAIAVFPADGGAVQIASAGHLPPLLVWDGGARFLDVSAGVALGVREDATYAGAPFALDEGSMLVLYTDSLVERRGEPIDAGLERLRRAGEGHGPHDTLCSALVELMDVTGDDDLAVVTVRWEES